MKIFSKLYLIVFFTSILFTTLIADNWTQTTKAEFNTGTHAKTVALNGSGANGDLQLQTTIYNGWFDEDSGSFDGWTDSSGGGAGQKLVEIVNAAGRTSIAHTYSTSTENFSYAKFQQFVSEDLDNLSRFRLDFYPISSQCSGDYKAKVRVQAYDASWNELLDTADQWDVIEYIIYGTSGATSTFHWSDRTSPDYWNYFIWDLKSHILQYLATGNEWEDVVHVKIAFETFSAYSGSTSGGYWDAIYAASFVEDDFDDNYLDLTKWIEHEGHVSIMETNHELKFVGTTGSNWHWSWVKSIPAITRQYTESSIRVKMVNLSGASNSFYFMFEAANDHNIRVLYENGEGYMIGWRDSEGWHDDGIWTPAFGNEASDFLTWRIVYDDDTNTMHAFVNGKYIGSHTLYLYNYGAKIVHDSYNAGNQVDIRVDDFTLLQFDSGDYEFKYPDTGNFISSAYDTGYAIPNGAIFQNISWNHTGDDIKFQLRTGETESELHSAGWLGPSNNPTGWYESSSYPINLDHYNDRWIQFKTELTTADQTTTPLLHDINIEYCEAYGITFTFDNFDFTDNGDVFEFDVMAHASQAGTKLGDNKIFVNYNTLGFGEEIINNGFAVITKGELLEGENRDPLYDIVVSDTSPSMFGVSSSYLFPAQPELANDLPNVPTQLLHVAIMIDDENQTSGLSFYQPEMRLVQYRSNGIHYSPVNADDTDDTFLSIVPRDLRIFLMPDEVILVWTAVPGADYYKIYVSHDTDYWSYEFDSLSNFWITPLNQADPLMFYRVTSFFEE